MIASILQRLPSTRGLTFLSLQKSCRYTTKTEEPEIPANPLKDVYSSSSQRDNGYVYDKRPFKIRCEAGKTYAWCLCGRSKSQPFCDGTHKNPFWRIKLRPVKFIVEETKDYWLCNCKQTSNRPFCDGTHLNEEIQELKRF